MVALPQCALSKQWTSWRWTIRLLSHAGAVLHLTGWLVSANVLSPGTHKNWSCAELCWQLAVWPGYTGVLEFDFTLLWVETEVVDTALDDASGRWPCTARPGQLSWKVAGETCSCRCMGLVLGRTPVFQEAAAAGCASDAVTLVWYCQDFCKCVSHRVIRCIGMYGIITNSTTSLVHRTLYVSLTHRLTVYAWRTQNSMLNA